MTSPFDDDLARLDPDDTSIEVPVDPEELDEVSADEHTTPLGADLEADIATVTEAYESE